MSELRCEWKKRSFYTSHEVNTNINESSILIVDDLNQIKLHTSDYTGKKHNLSREFWSCFPETEVCSRKTGSVTVTVTCCSVPRKPVSPPVQAACKASQTSDVSSLVDDVHQSFLVAMWHALTLLKGNVLFIVSTYQRCDCTYRASCGLRLHKGDREVFLPGTPVCWLPPFIQISFFSSLTAAFSSLSDRADSCDFNLTCPKHWKMMTC